MGKRPRPFQDSRRQQRLPDGRRRLDKVPADKGILDACSEFGAGQAFHVDLAQYREIDVAILIYGISGYGLRVIGTDALRHTSEALADIWKVEKVGQLVIGSIHDNRDLVLGAETDMVLLDRLGESAGVGILEIGDIGRGSAGND